MDQIKCIHCGTVTQYSDEDIIYDKYNYGIFQYGRINCSSCEAEMIVGIKTE